MTKRDWTVAIVVGVIIGLAITTFGLTEWVSPLHTRASGSIDDVLDFTLNSHTKWETVQGEAEITWYGPEGDTQQYIDRFEISQPGSAHFELVGSSEKETQRLWISDGFQIFTVDQKSRTFTTEILPRFALDLTVLPKSLTDTSDDTVYHYPFALIIPSPVAEYIFPHWFAQGQPDAEYHLLRTDELLGRKVWVVEYNDSQNYTVSWIDQTTGVILRFMQEVDNRKFVEFEMLSISFDSFIDLSHFSVPEGYSLDGKADK